MKLRKFNKIFNIFFIILISFEFSKCEDCTPVICQRNGLVCQNVDTTHDCSPNCKPKIGASTCHDCSGIQENGYYSISSDGTCLINQCIGDKIIEIGGNLKECTSQTITPSDSIYKVGELGDYYYYFTSVDNDLYDCTSNICTCKKYYYIETIYGKKKYNCFNTLEAHLSSNYKFYNYNTGQFFQTECPEGLKVMKIIRIENVEPEIIRCSSTCFNSEKILEIQNNGLIEHYCVDNCPTTETDPYKFEYTDNNNIKKCLSTCPEGTKKLDNNKCVTPDNTLCAFYKGDTCYPSCSSVPNYGETSYHYCNYGSKECISSCTGVNIYTKSNDNEDTTKICYSSCLEIPGGEYIYEVFNNDKYICYTSKPTQNCEVFYKKNDGIRKCTTKADCVSNNKNYIINDECKDNCDGYYQIEITQSSSLNYINCFETYNKAFANSNVKFCDTQLRKCWTNFPNGEGYFIKSKYSSTPDKYELTKECNNFYLRKDDNTITNGELFWCVSNCKSNEGKFYVNGNKECKTSCSDFYKYYYDDSNNECLDSCELRHGKQFYYLNDPKCLDTCGENKFYNYNSHICLSHCGEDNSLNLYYKNNGESVRACYPSCLDIPQRGTYKYIIDDYKCFTEAEKGGITGCDYYYKYNGMLKCASVSDCYNEGYKYLIDNECISKCKDNEYKLETSIGTGDAQVTMQNCLSSPSDCQTKEGGTNTKIYYHESLKMCWTTYQDKYFLKSETNSGNLFELVDECDNFHFINTNDNNNKYCIPTCLGKSLYYIAGNKKCIENTVCISNHKYYYDPSNNECLDTCKGRSTYGTQKELPINPSALLPCLSNCIEQISEGQTQHLYYNYDSNICMDYCGKDGSNKKYHAENSYICYSSCSEIPGDFKYVKQTEENTPSLHIDYTCYSTYSSSNCPYYYLNSDGSKKCQQAIDCFNMNYIYLIMNSGSNSNTDSIECRNQCDDYYKLDETITINSGQTNERNLQFIKCFQEYTNCGATASNPIYYNEKDKRCWKTPPEYYYIIDNNDNTNYNFKVLEKCDNYYYIDTANNYKHCTTACKLTGSPGLNLFFVNGNQKCESDCINFGKYYYDTTNNECLDTCKGRTGYGFQNQITSTPTNAIACINRCDTNTFYDFDSNICIESCGDNDLNKKYRASDGNICYLSCTDIPNKNYIYEKNNICYESPPTDPNECEYYYTKPNGAKQCTYKYDCIKNKNYKFFIGNECRENCDGYYKFKTSGDIPKNDGTTDAENLEFTICFESIGDVIDDTQFNIKYYNIKSKLCWNTYPSGYYIKKYDTTPTPNKLEVFEECEHFYYKITDSVQTNQKSCTNSCFSESKFFSKGKKNCEDSCTVFNKYYYNPQNNECLDTCIGLENNLEFANKVDFNANPVVHQSCIQNCESPNEHYNYGTKICISACNVDGYKYTQSGDTNKICYNSCAQIPGNLYIYEINDVCFKKEELTATNCPFYYLQDDGSKKCIESESACKTNGFDYLYGQECLKKCDGYFILQDETGTNIPKICFLTLSDALQSSKGIKYYHQNLRQCWINYPSGFYIKSKDSDNSNDNWEVVENCDKFYYEKNEEISGVTYNHKYCVDNCKIDNTLNLYFIQNQQKCETQCPKYYDPTNNECLDTCIGRTNLEFSNPIPDSSSSQPCLNKCPKYFNKKTDGSNKIIAYECVNDCPITNSNYKYIDVKTNECLIDCPDNDSTLLVNGKCYPKCDVANNYRYIDTDTYKCILACPSNLKKMEYLTEINNEKIYLCKSMCQENEYRLEEKCFKDCPEEYNFIGNNNICKPENCNGDLNGESYYQYKELTKADPSTTYFVYKCISSCQDTQGLATKYLYHEETNPKKCLNVCPPETFILDYSCLSRCPDNYPFYSTQDHICHAVNICNGNTEGNNYFLNGECVSKNGCTSNGKKYIDSQNMCMDKCRDDEYNEKDESDNSIILCKKVCDKYKYQKNIESVLECVKDCPEDKHFIGKNDICKQSCDEEDGLNFYEITPSSTINYKIYLCTSGCPENYRYREANNENSNQCYQNCPNDYPYKSEDELKCYSNCLESNINNYTLNKYAAVDSSEIIPHKCDKQCNQDSDFKYFGQDKICITDCSILGSTKLTNYNNECINKCDLNSKYRFQLDNKCVEECEDDATNTDPDHQPKKRYSSRDYICKVKCDEDENIVKEGRICSDKCDGFLNPLNQYEYECLPSCSKTPNIYYYETDKICLSKCNNDDKVVEGKNICVRNCADLTDKKYYFYEKDLNDQNDFNKCVLNCPENKPLIYEDKCVISCPSEKKYFVGEIRHEDYHKCNNDCPISYPYYKIIQNALDNTKQDYVCIDICVKFHVPNTDTKIIATLCLDSCPSPSGIYKYQIGNDKCYEVCPPEAKYHFDLDTTPVTQINNNCYESCPEIQSGKTFHKRGETICLTLQELDGFGNGYILYEEKEWTNIISSCPYGFKTKAERGDFTLTYNIIICSNKCTEYGQYLTPYNTCVKDCENSDLVRGMNLKSDENNKKCICKKLFYIDENSHQKTCYEDTITSCLSTTNGYTIPLKPTNECLKSCSSNRILNPSEDACYEAGTQCSTINKYTTLVTVEGKLKCDCKYKFYYDSNNKKICLDENDICPETKKKYFPDTMQCIEACPSDYYTFKNYCLKECPGGSTIDETRKICDCQDRFWYKASEGNYECLNQDADCLDTFPLYSEDKECLKSCKNTYYPYFFENKCYDKCEVANTEKVLVTNSPYAVYKCDCLRPWYYEIDTANNKEVMHCPGVNDGIKECKDYETTLINMIEETRQCLEECPLEYQYLFNELCFTSCKFADDKYKFNIEKVDPSLICNCQNLWHKNITDPEKKVCYVKTRNECPIESDSNTFDNYLIYNTKECVDTYEDCPPNSFKFNHICYDKCPPFTLEGASGDNNENNCICDKRYLWLKYEKYGTIYYKCGLEACPETSFGDNYKRNNLLESENQCVSNCKDEGPDDNDYIYSFRGKCVKECPTKTRIVNNACDFYDVKSPGYVDDLDDLKEKANIQAKELYEKESSIPGFIKHDFGASLQIYALNKINSYKQLAMQSNLTYIDLGTCLDKIYAANNLKDSDNILVTKYDLLERTHKSNNDNNDGTIRNGDNTGNGGGATSPNSGNTYTDDNYLINQVEYEFYLQSTNKKIEGSICSPYEIEISYPIFYNKNKYNNYQLGKNYNNYLKQFMIGKDLHSKDAEIDTFNKDNKIYKDMCIGVEINGKDLVLEDRYNYLYPNNVSLCESNCTMKNTDFDLQRINCMCTYKEIIDFKRIDEDTNDILNDPDFEKPTQSSANAQIIKCITKIGVKEGIKKNEAFYFCTISSGIIIIMSIVSAFTAVKSVTNFMNGMLQLNGVNNAQSLKYNNIATSTNRLINNPPKKGELNETKDNNNDNSDNNDKGNIVIKKNIKLNYNPKNDTENDVSEISINNDISNNFNNKTMNYGINIKSNIPRIRNRSKNISNRNNYTQYQTQNDFSNKKAEYIPTQYNFKFFKPGDKGVIKKIFRSEIPFEVDKNTNILLEVKNGISYDENYLEGPYYEEQNIIEIIDDNKKDNNIEINIYTKNDNKIVKFSDNNNTKSNKKNNTKVDITNYIDVKQDNDDAKKRCITNNLNSTDKEFIKIKKINPITNLHIPMENYRTDDEIKEVDNTTSIYTLMKREHTFLRVTYEKYISKSHPNILATFLAEILDKIYLIKIFIFLKKFENLSIQVALYLFYHILVLSLLCGFFTIKIIKKIWEESNYPTINFYLLYGLISHIIIWVIYRMFILVLDNQDKIRALVKLNNEVQASKENSDENRYGNKKEEINDKYKDLIKKIKIQIIVFYLVVIAITAFCYIYLVSFFAIYTGTKSKVFKAYYISLIEIVIIKFVYGLCLGSLRIASEGNELKSLYNFVYFFDKYIS